VAAVGVLYVDASSPEEFVSRVMGFGEFGLDTASGEVLVSPYDGRRVCWGRPPTPVAVYQSRAWPRAGGSVLGRGVYWFRAVGLFKRGREWLVASSCRRRPPLVGWQRAPADVVADVLLAHARERYWAYWPRGIGELAREPSHVVVAGASATGKTTFVKSLLKTAAEAGVDFAVLDLTGEYEELGGACEASIDLSAFTVDELVSLYAAALSAATGAEGAVTGVQYGVLRKHAQAASSPARLIKALAGDREVPELTRQVLLSKLVALCRGWEGGGECEPHPFLHRPTPKCRVYRVVANDSFLAALVVHGVVLHLLKRGVERPTFVAVDEYHRVASRDPVVEDPVERAIREGRHKGVYFVVATQNPLDLKRPLLDIVPTHVYFALYGEAAQYAARVLNVPVHVVESLGQGQWLAKTRSRPRRWA